MTEREKMLKGEVYDVYDEELIHLRGRARELCFLIDNLNPTKNKEERAALFRELLGKTKNFTIHRGFKCDYGVNITLGANFYANCNLVVLDCAAVTIKDNVMIGPNCSLITATHPLNAKERAKGIETAKAITIENNVWLAEGVTVLPGVTIGENSVIGAKSLVTKDIPPNVLAFGNPCRVVRTID